MKTKNLNYLFFTILIVIFSSCTKERVETNIDVPAKNEMLVFNSMEEYRDAIKKTISFNHEELKVWEEQQGFTSYGRKCEEVFFSEDFESFKNLDAFKHFVELNYQYVELYEESGEYTLDVKYYNCLARFLMNTDRMYQISDTIFKEFTNGVAYVEASDGQLLKSITGDTYTGSRNYEIGFKESNMKNINSGKAGCYGGTDRATSGRDRVRIKIYQDYERSYSYDRVSIYAEIRPYKRTLGVWYWCSRSITGELKWRYKIYDGDYITETMNWESHYTRFIEVVRSKDVRIGAVATFDYYDFKARVPATGYAELYCGLYFPKD
ncbi:MAG: hypothetical protein PHW91_06270 [Bacteroidales bacterium]|nr:hypothetical protein [Bacteroidales bacterium]